MIYSVHLGLIAELQAAGDLEEWAVYVALHLPEHASPEWPDLREGLVRDLITMHAPAWESNPDKRAFLRDTLGIPAPWLATGQALWLRSLMDLTGM